MIVVSVGTNEARFDRILEWLDGIGISEEALVQHGPSPIRPAGARCVAYVPYEELAALLDQSRVFVTHAGVGSIIVSLAAGLRPVVVPRLRRFGEAVDDHQLELARRMSADGLVTLVESPDALAAAVADADHAIVQAIGATALQRELREYLAALTRA